ncbi:MAG TPA: GspH/FimT family pseudopilin [Usitatibacter sp.]|nr:GspH/FimT family pseudopilin [Usitatibacter sp.]
MRKSAGFTLLELLVVLALAAVIYAVLLGVPLRGGTSADLKASARTLAAALRETQATAMATRHDATLTLDLESREFKVAGEKESRKLPSGIDLKLYTAESEVTSERVGAIRFYPDGSSTGGRITVSSGERKFLVDVDWLTGRVSIED